MSMGSVAKLAPLWSASTPSIASVVNPPQIDAELQALERLGVDELRLQWRNRWGRLEPAHLSRALLFRAMAYRIQAEAFGDLDRQIARRLDRLAQEAEARTTGGAGVLDGSHPPARSRSQAIGSDSPLVLKPGALLTREWRGRIERGMALDEGFAWNGKTYAEPIRRRLRRHRHEVERPSVLLRRKGSPRRWSRTREPPPREAVLLAASPKAASRQTCSVRGQV